MKKHPLLIILSLPIAFIIVMLSMLLVPLNDDENTRKKGIDTHEELQRIKQITSLNFICVETCPVCHPVTWRLNTRINKIKEFFHLDEQTPPHKKGKKGSIDLRNKTIITPQADTIPISAKSLDSIFRQLSQED